MAINPLNSPFPTAASVESQNPGQGPVSREIGGTPRHDPSVNQFVQGAHDAVDRVAEKAIPAVERLRSGVSDAAEAVQLRADALGELSDEWLETARTSVREHPIAAVALGIVAGIAVSRLLSSR